MLSLFAGDAFGLMTGKPISCGLSITARNAIKDMTSETVPNDINVVRQPKFSVTNAAINGDTPPEMFAEALSKLQKVPNWSGENYHKETNKNVNES